MNELAPAVALFRSLGDPVRLAIVHRLAAGEARVVDLTAALGLAQSTVSQHVACLRDCGLVAARVDGRQSFYALTRPELMDLLRSAERLLAETGAVVALCPNYGAPGTCGEPETRAHPGREGGPAAVRPARDGRNPARPTRGGGPATARRNGPAHARRADGPR